MIDVSAKYDPNLPLRAAAVYSPGERKCTHTLHLVQTRAHAVTDNATLEQHKTHTNSSLTAHSSNQSRKEYNHV